MNMKCVKGKSVLKKIAIGRIHFYTKEQARIEKTDVKDALKELKRFEDALSVAEAEINYLYDTALNQVGEAEAAIFEIHQMMLEDEDFQDAIRQMIRDEGCNAEFAVSQAQRSFSLMFSQMEDEYMQARASDIQDISQRVIRILSGEEIARFHLEEPIILVAEDLTPSETVQMDKSKLLGFVTHLGSANSHTAILSRTMNIPALIGVEVSPDWNGKMAIIDGYHGCVYLEPEPDLLREMRKKQQREEQECQKLLSLRGKEPQTLDGKKVLLYANVGDLDDVQYALQNGAQGIGLFRSEFLYLGKKHYPEEEEQFSIYRQALKIMEDKRVIIRTLDIGADKQIDYFGLDKEENPALGYRAIRICLDRTDLFKTQLRALLRASVYGKLAIMYPMVISTEEVRRIQVVFEEACQELQSADIPYGKVEQGIMVETPAAVMVSDQLASMVDFFSIGTNDLSQYTLAIDRQNTRLDSFFDPHHPAILRMIEMVIKNAHEKGIWVGICGELGADSTLTETFLRMGVDELSVSPSCILPLKKQIIGLKLNG